MAEKSVKYGKFSEENKELGSEESGSFEGEGPSGEESVDHESSKNEATDKNDNENITDNLFPETTIRRIDKSIDRFTGLDPKGVCECIIKKHQQEKGGRYQLVNLRGHPSLENFSILAYRERKIKKDMLGNIFELNDQAEISTVSYIVFLITKNGSIYCITYGTAHFVVKNFEDSQFPINVAKYATSKNIRRVDQRKLQGIHYATRHFFRSPSIPDYLQVNGVVTNFQGRVGNRILQQMEALQLETKEGARIQVSRSGVSFAKKLNVSQMCHLIKELDENMPQKADGCDILEYIVEVTDKTIIDGLEEKMFDRILKDVNKSGDVSTPPFDFMFKEYETHMKGKEFSFSLSRGENKTGREYEELQFYNDAVAKLKCYLKTKLKEIKLSVLKNGKKSQYSFLTFLHGLVEYQNTTYQKNDQEWIISDGSNVGNRTLQSTLEDTMLSQILIDMLKINELSQGESFEFYYHSKEEHNNLTKFSFGRNDTASDKLSTYSDALCKLKLFLRKSLIISFKVEEKMYDDMLMNFFHGEVIYEGMERNDRSLIYHKVDGKWYRYDQNFNERLERCFKSLIQRKFVDNKHLKEIWTEEMTETEYNRLYCKYDDHYVGDRIITSYIELFDIMKVEDNRIYLYHVKEGFGAITRVACSQIRNSASAISESRHGGGKTNYITTFYNNVTTYNANVTNYTKAPKTKEDEKFRMTEKQKLEKVKADEFMKWFQEKEIVFVYAFAINKEVIEEKKREVKLNDYLKEENLKKFSKSTIARHDLYNTNLFLEELGFGFEICQIYREGTNYCTIL